MTLFEGLSVLAEGLKEEMCRQCAIHALTDMGAQAKATLEHLKTLAGSSDEVTRWLAENAIEQINRN